VIPFSILATAMLAALVLAVWVTLREFRRVDSAENPFGITSESVKKPAVTVHPAASRDDQQVELDEQVWGSG
jgi:hypothetical protein